MKKAHLVGLGAGASLVGLGGLAPLIGAWISSSAIADAPRHAVTERASQVALGIERAANVALAGTGLLVLGLTLIGVMVILILLEQREKPTHN